MALLTIGVLHFIREYFGLLTANALRVPMVVLLWIIALMLPVALCSGLLLLLSREDSLPQVDKSDEAPASGNEPRSIGAPPALSAGKDGPSPAQGNEQALIS